MADVTQELEKPKTAEPMENTTPTKPVESVNPRAEHRMTVAERVIYLVGGIVLGLMAIRFLLSLFGANRVNGFADFIYSVTHPFVSPFFGLFNYTEQFGRSRFEFETLIAIAFYGLVMVVLARLVTLGSHQPR